MKAEREAMVQFAEYGPTSRYWLEAFDPGSPLHRFLPIGTLDEVPFPQNRIEEWRSRSNDRETLVRSFEESGLPSSSAQRRALESLRNTDAVVVVTGQQPGALGGPLYTFAKIVSAIAFAERLQERWKVPVVPVLWDGGDDHDLAEVDHLHWPDLEGEPRKFHIDLSPFQGHSAWSVPLTSDMLSNLLGFIEEIHPETEFRKQTTEFICSTWADSRSWCDFFDRFWLRIFEKSPLLVIRPWDDGFRKAATRVLQEEVAHPEAFLADFERISEDLRDAGYKPHVHKKEGVCSFFRIEGGKRLSVNYWEGDFHIQEHEHPIPPEQMLAEYLDNPSLLSPNALVRPVVQDSILPTAVSVLGPGEIAYHAQIGAIYERHRVPRPWIVPRFSLSIASRNQAKHLEDLGISWLDLLRDDNELAKETVTSESLETALQILENLKTETDSAGALLRDLAIGAKSDMARGIESQFGKIKKTLSQVEDLVKRDETKRQSSTVSRLRRLKGNLRPDGELQERIYGLAPYLCRHGFDWIEDIMCAAADWDGKEHILHFPGG